MLAYIHQQSKNSEDLDQLASQKPADLDIHFFFKTGHIRMQHLRVNVRSKRKSII